VNALVVHFGGVAWGRVTLRSEARCWFCAKAIRAGVGSYRTHRWGPTGAETAHAHGRCLHGQIDPTIYDIGIPGR